MLVEFTMTSTLHLLQDRHVDTNVVHAVAITMLIILLIT